MNRYLICALITVLVTGCSTSAKSPKTPPASDTAAEMPRLSGIVRENVDDSVRAQDDFFRYVNGNWLKKAEIPADKSIWGAFAELRENTRPELRTLIEAAARNPAAAPGSEERKIGDLYASFMDEDTLETLGLRPLAAEFARVAALTDKRQIPALIAHFNRIGADAPYDLSIGQDARASTKYAVILSQSGLGLPDRDYYLKDDDAKLKAVRAKYLAHIEKMLKMAEDRNPTASARAILALETAIAKTQWTKVRNRDPVQTYNKTAIARLPELTPGYPWATYLQDVGIARKVDYVIVSQPSYFTDFGRLWKTTSLPAWKAYFKWRLLSAYARYLPKAYADEHFAFYGTALSGVPQNQARWKRGVTLVEGAIGEGLGKLYVAKYFPPETKAHMERLVRNLLAAYRTSIDALDWMSPATKKEAQAKLARFNTKIGYPNKWRDYTRMRIVKDDLIGNVRRANAFEYQRNIDKLGHSIDREEWAMTPQTVNAYYDPEKNEIVFPAAILQPPFFNAKADDAVNYGA
ncbi:MAG TPA: M13-type metalloendopeptidase, partial [Burkholderiaceae bacterium]|nr:M13-type metalloendopeptidase [Burkholderiaceae bacterium]